ncbi:9876_t:CDS:1, partial [Diversispora eburnea]
RPTGCYRYWHLYEKNIEKFPCGVCKKPTISITGYCPKYSGRFHSLNYRMRQKGVIQDPE